jgi:hypothetical protein
MEYTTFSKYLKVVFWLTSFFLITIALINYKVDPSGIYKSPLLKPDSQKLVASNNQSLLEWSFITQLVESDLGLNFPVGFNERRLKHTLALYPTTAECVVIGSSHVMQISSFSQQKSLTHTCSSILNLGVSGGSLEDYLVFSEVIPRNKRPPKTIIFGIDPWSLNFSRDKRWLLYLEEFENMRSKLITTKRSSYGGDFFDFPLLRNLFNGDYLMESVRYFLSSLPKNEIPKNEIPKNEIPKNEIPKNEIPKNEIPKNELEKRHSWLPDGSLIYSKRSKKNMQGYKVNGIHTYMIDKHHYFEKKAVELFTLLVLHLKQKHNVIFILTPYHPAVWKLQNQPVVTAMKLVEQKIHQIAKSVGVLVIGSYNPRAIGCNADEFIDEMHPKPTCLAKLETFSSQY